MHAMNRNGVFKEVAFHLLDFSGFQETICLVSQTYPHFCDNGSIRYTAKLSDHFLFFVFPDIYFNTSFHRFAGNNTDVLKAAVQCPFFKNLFKIKYFFNKNLV